MLLSVLVRLRRPSAAAEAETEGLSTTTWGFDMLTQRIVPTRRRVGQEGPL